MAEDPRTLLQEWLDTELDPQDEEYQPWMDDFTARVREAMCYPHAAPVGPDLIEQLEGALVNSEGRDFQIRADFVRELIKALRSLRGPNLSDDVFISLLNLQKMKADRITGGSPGPLYGAGWAAACQHWADVFLGIPDIPEEHKR